MAHTRAKVEANTPSATKPSASPVCGRLPRERRSHGVGVRAMVSLLLLGALLWSLPAMALTGTRESAFEYDPTTGLLTKEIVEPNNLALRLVKEYEYDAYGNVTKVTVYGGNDANNATETASDVPKRSTSTTYDARGQFATQVTNALNHSETWVTDPKFGVPTSQTGPNGLTTSWEYDTFGRKTKDIAPDGNQAQYQYGYCGPYCVDTAEFWTGVLAYASDGTTQNGGFVFTYFDGLARSVAVEREGVNNVPRRWTRSYYDSFGRLEAQSRPFFSGTGKDTCAPSGGLDCTKYVYDDLGRQTQVTAPDGSFTTLSYSGQVSSVTNALSQTTTSTVNARGEVVNVTDNAGTTTYTYDPFGNLLTMTDPAGNVTTHTYDTRGRKTQSADPDMGTWTYDYNVLDQLTSQTDAKSQTATLAYDLLGRVTQRVEPGLTSNWAFDTQTKGIGKLATATTDAGYSRTHTYDSLGRAVSTTTTIDSTDYTASMTYDANGRVTQEQRNSGTLIDYVYNSLGYLTQVKDNATGAMIWRADTRDADQQLTQATLGNGIVVHQAFDAQTGRIDSIRADYLTSGDIADMSFTFDVLGNVTQRVDRKLPHGAYNELTENFTYDTVNRLTNYDIVGGAAKTVSYDAIGNITAKSDVGTYAYPATGAARPHAVSSITSASGTDVNGVVNPTYTYDANGNMTAGAGRTVTYTSFNKVATITQGATNITYAYNGEHGRIKQVAGSETTIYLGMTEKKIASGGAVTWHDYIEADGKRVALRVHDVNAATTDWKYFIHDHIGSTSVVTNASAGVDERYSFDAWGKRRFLDGTDDALGSLYTAGFWPTTRGFTGHEQIPDVGLVNMNARIYDPEIGRFMQADSIIPHEHFSQALNRYSYIYNNPMSGVDPDGHFGVVAAFFIAAAITAVAIITDIPILKAIAGIAWAVAFAQFGPFNAYANAFAGGFIGGGIEGGDLKSAVLGGITALAFAGIHGLKKIAPSGAHHITGTQSSLYGLSKFAGTRVGSAVLHGLVGGLSAVVRGGKFAAGFLAAGISNFAGSFVRETGNLALDTGVRAIIGGASSVIAGGKFANGAITAAFGYLYNDQLESAKESKRDEGPLIDSARPSDEILEILGRPSHHPHTMNIAALIRLSDNTVQILGALATIIGGAVVIGAGGKVVLVIGGILLVGIGVVILVDAVWDWFDPPDNGQQTTVPDFRGSVPPFAPGRFQQENI